MDKINIAGIALAMSKIACNELSPADEEKYVSIVRRRLQAVFPAADVSVVAHSQTTLGIYSVSGEPARHPETISAVVRAAYLEFVTDYAENMPITHRIYQYVIAWKSIHNGNSPSVRQIRDGVGVRSTSTVWRYLRMLQRANVLAIDGARNITVPGSDWRMDW